MNLEKVQKKSDLQLQIVKHPEFGEIRVCVVNKGKEVLYHGNDVAIALDYNSPRDAIRNNVEENHKVLLKSKNFGVENNSTPKLNNAGEMFISQAGLYGLILDSNKPNAKAFRAWITEDVLDSIEKYGYYSVDQSSFNSIKNVYKMMGKEEDAEFKYQANTKISAISRMNKKLKGSVWKDFVRIYNTIFHTNLSMKLKNFKEEYNIKTGPTYRQFADLMDNRINVMVVLNIMLLGPESMEIGKYPERDEALKETFEYMTSKLPKEAVDDINKTAKVYLLQYDKTANSRSIKEALENSGLAQ